MDRSHHLKSTNSLNTGSKSEFIFINYPPRYCLETSIMTIAIY